MYIPINDNELLYLIREGNQTAQRVLYLKYEHLIGKLFRENWRVQHWVFADFKQECLMCLEQAIRSFKENKNSTFYSYFLLLVNRNNSKILRKNALCLKEQSTEYFESHQAPSTYDSHFIQFIVRQLDLRDDLERDLFYECLLNHRSITQIAKKNNTTYANAYLKYKKIKDKAEKILTNQAV